MRKKKLKKRMRDLEKGQADLLEQVIVLVGEREFIKEQVRSEFEEAWTELLEGNDVEEIIRVAIHELAGQEFLSFYASEDFYNAVRNIVDGLALNPEEILECVVEGLQTNESFQNEVLKANQEAFRRYLPAGIGGHPGAPTTG